MTEITVATFFAGHSGKLTDKWDLYLAEYDRLLSSYRDKPIRLLEIGVQNGGSIDLWSQLFPKALHIIGCDVNPKCALLSYDDPRVTIIVGDVRAAETKAAILAKADSLDLIIDDGSHRSSEIIAAFANYFPVLADGGLFVIEDLHCSYWQEYEGGLHDPFSSLSFFKKLVDIANYEHWGVETTPTRLLASFALKYGVSFEEDMLQHIHSIEFVNSLCVVRKMAPENNRLGVRRTAGDCEIIVKGHIGLNDSAGTAPSQATNEWGLSFEGLEIALAEHIAKVKKLSRLGDSRDTQIDKLGAMIDERETTITAIREEGLLKDHRISALVDDLKVHKSQSEDLLTSLATIRQEVSLKDRRISALVDNLKAQKAQIEDLTIDKAYSDNEAVDLSQHILTQAERISEVQNASQYSEAKILELSALVSSSIRREHTSATANRILVSRIASLERSRLGRLARIINRARRPFVGMALMLTPLQHLDLLDDDGSSQVWEMTGIDPQFSLGFGADAFVPGHYVLTGWSAGGAVGFIRPRLYVDIGGGVSEATSIPLRLQSRPDGAWSAMFTLPDGARQLRFDPSVKPGRIKIGGVRIRRRTRLERYGRLCVSLALRHLKSPTDAAIALQRVGTSLARGGLRHLAKDLRRLEERGNGDTSYEHWVALYDTLEQNDVVIMKRLLPTYMVRPLISIILPTYNTPDRLLRECIDSVLAQTYDNWELCIADDCSTTPNVWPTIQTYAKGDHRVKIVRRSENGHISNASNSALEMATGEWVALLDHDDTLAPHALFCVVDAINKNPEAKLIYSDEDKIDDLGKRFEPYFKCDWNYDLFLSQNMISHLGVYHRELISTVGGFRVGFEGAQDYDLALRCVEHLNLRHITHIPQVLYHWRVIPGSTALSAAEKPYAMLAGERALNEHLARRKVSAKARLIGFGYAIDYELPKPEPLVSIIIPTKNAHKIVKKCIDSIQTKTLYSNYEIILVDNGSDQAESLAYFKYLSESRNVVLIRDASEFNYSLLNNRAADRAKGEILALVNNDIVVIDGGWLNRMVSVLIQPEVGAVGAKLLYPDGGVQHAGVILGVGGIAGHSHKHVSRSSNGYFGRTALAQSVSAVTGACLVVRRDVFQSVGGLDEENLAVAYNDIDLCLKIGQLGLRIVLVPDVVLYHEESVTRGIDASPDKIERFERESSYIRQKWSSLIERDPAYNPNLTLDYEDFSLAFPPRTIRPWLERYRVGLSPSACV